MGRWTNVDREPILYIDEQNDWKVVTANRAIIRHKVTTVFQ